jgi:hypothetical protein
VWTIKLSLQFLEIIGIELDHTPKIESVPHNLFYRFANIQKILSSVSNSFEGPNRDK